MQIPIPEISREETRHQLRQLFVPRLRIALAAVLSVVTAFVLVDEFVLLRQAPALRYVHIAQISVIAAALGLLRSAGVRARVDAFAFLMISFVYVSAAATGVVVADRETPAIMFTAISMGTAVVLPWSSALQLASVTVGAAALLWNFISIEGALVGPAIPPFVGVVVSFLVSVVIVGRLDRERRIKMQLDSQLRSSQDQLQRAVEELQSEGRVRELFLANMSHELRTPLNVILGYLEMVLDGAFGDLAVEQREVVEIAEMRSRDLLSLMETTLEISRYESRGIPLRVESRDLAEWWEEMRRDLTAQAPKPGVEVSWYCVGHLPLAETDWSKLAIVVSNLVTNAVKYTEEGAVRVEAKGARDEIEIVVSDTGIGMTRAAQEKVFEPFEQVSGAAHNGVGLGLYIVRRLIDALGGEIHVDSDVGQGSTFRVRVPCQATPQRAAAG